MLLLAIHVDQSAGTITFQSPDLNLDLGHYANSCLSPTIVYSSQLKLFLVLISHFSEEKVETSRLDRVSQRIDFFFSVYFSSNATLVGQQELVPA